MRTPPSRGRRGNCYVTSEALFHLLGGKRAGWKSMQMRTNSGESHWFLKHNSGLIMDPTVKQFGNDRPEYAKARGTGFLTKEPSKRAKALIERMLWAN